MSDHQVDQLFDSYWREIEASALSIGLLWLVYDSHCNGPRQMLPIRVYHDHLDLLVLDIGAIQVASESGW